MAKIEKFLAAGSRIVIRKTEGGKPTKRCEWYQIKKDVPLTGHMQDVIDPMNPDSGETVKHTHVDKVPVYFPERLVRTRVVLEADDVDPSALNTQYAIFHYDAPDSFNVPYPLLYRIAVRLSKSCWIMRAGDAPYNLMASMLDGGCTVGFDKYDTSESGKHISRAVEGLMAYARERVAAAEQSRRTATEQLEGAFDEGLTEEQARKRYENRIKLIEKQLKDAEEQVSAAMKVFGIRCDGFVNVARLSQVRQQTRTTMAERALAYQHATRTLAETNTTDAQALAVAATNSQVLPGVMADALREAGNEEAADALQAAFSDNEFSLVE